MAKRIFERNGNGELIYNELNAHIAKKYKPDNLFDKPFVPYVVMVIAGLIDVTFFIALFNYISYESKFMIAIEVCCFIVGFDLVPVFLGIQLRRIKQGLSKDKFIMYLALAVCVIACTMNIVLRITTMDQIAPDLSSASTSIIGTVDNNAEDKGVSATAVALTIVGIGGPLITSGASFYVSYLCYYPLQIRKRKLEEMIGEKNDEIRRIEADLDEYKADPNFAEHLQEDDEKKYDEMYRMQRALLVSYCEYVRQRLKEHLADDPTAVNVLSEEVCSSILERLDREIAALYESDDTV